MSTKVMTDEEEETGEKLPRQAFSFLLHTLIGLGAWVLLMLLGYLIQPASVSQTLILLLSIGIPLAVASLITRAKPNEMAPHVWLVGFIWIMIISLWILDMPTGPNQCNQCSATEKLTRSLFSYPRPSGLIDDNGPFICTWPAAALIGYSLGARLTMRRKRPAEQ